MSSPVLERELVGAPVLVRLGKDEYRLAYPMKAVILYKQRTAEIDQRRARAKDRLKPAEIRELRLRRSQVIAELRAALPAPGSTSESDRQRIEALEVEALAIKSRLDEDAGTGDSLFQMENWRKINPEEDPERLLACLWAGLESNHPELKPEQLELLVHPGNVTEITVAIAKALASYLPRRAESPDPNAPAPAGTPAEAAAK